MSIDRTPLRHTHLASLVLGAAALLAASGAHAQSAAVPLDCSAGQTTASVTIVTDTTWQQSTDGGTSWASAANASNGGWGAAPTGSSWIGNGSSGPVTPLFSRVLQLGAGVDLVVPLTVSATFLVDDTLGGLTVGGLATGISGGTYNGAPTTATGSVTLPAAGNYPIIATVNNTGGGAYGLAANLTITATCRAAPPAAVPADAPWALGMLTGTIGLVAAAAVRRRRRG